MGCLETESKGGEVTCEDGMEAGGGKVHKCPLNSVCYHNDKLWFVVMLEMTYWTKYTQERMRLILVPWTLRQDQGAIFFSFAQDKCIQVQSKSKWSRFCCTAQTNNLVPLLFLFFLLWDFQRYETKENRHEACLSCPSGSSCYIHIFPLHAVLPLTPCALSSSLYVILAWKLWFPILTGSRKRRKLPGHLCSKITGGLLTKPLVTDMA